MLRSSVIGGCFELQLQGEREQTIVLTLVYLTAGSQVRYGKFLNSPQVALLRF